MLPATLLDGPCVSLRLAQVNDAKALLTAMEPESTQNLQFFTTTPSLQAEISYLQQMSLSMSDVLYVIIENTTGRIVGTIGLHEIDSHLKLARLGLLIFKQSDRHRGFGNDATAAILRFAYRELGLNKVFVNVFLENTRGQEHWRKLGFTTEGILREEYLLRGDYHDLVRLTMLAREWQPQHEKE